MKIKTKKKMNLSELIEWVWDNDIKNKRFVTDSEIKMTSVLVSLEGLISIEGFNITEVDKEDTFTVEVEEEITEDTKLDTLIEVYTEGSETIVHDIGRNIMNDFDRETPEVAINDVCSSDTLELHTLIGGKLVKIWSKEKGLVG